MKIKLPQVTLLGIDCVNVDRLQEVMNICEEQIEFGASKILSSLPLQDNRLVSISYIGTVELYSQFCIDDLHKYVDTEYVLIVQYDGFILRPEVWKDEFLGYDYIGAPWLGADWLVERFGFPKEWIGKRITGNGGFSIRSKKFLEISSRLSHEGKLPQIHPEDIALCVWYRSILEKEGVVFAPPELAIQFSIEGSKPGYTNQFGFHGFRWTPIEEWINTHPQYTLTVQEYKTARLNKIE